MKLPMKAVLAASATCPLTGPAPAFQDDRAPRVERRETPRAITATIERRSVTFEAALVIARRAIDAGEEKGDELAVAVVDRSGIPLVVLRADGGTEQFVTGATRKDRTAVNFRASTRDVLESLKSGEGAAPSSHTPGTRSSSWEAFR